MMLYSRSEVSTILLLLYFMYFFSLLETQKQQLRLQENKQTDKKLNKEKTRKHFTETYLFINSEAKDALRLPLFSAFIDFPSRKRKRSSIVPMKWN